jgi:hypothetical protein
MLALMTAVLDRLCGISRRGFATRPAVNFEQPFGP